MLSPVRRERLGCDPRHEPSAVNQKTSTEKMAEALDQLMGITDREKRLRHRDGLTEEETAELVALEDAREAERQRNYQEWGRSDSRRGDKKKGGLSTAPPAWNMACAAGGYPFPRFGPCIAARR
jgi:hypothetical protein